MCLEFTKMKARKNENLTSFKIFLNADILAAFAFNSSKFETYIFKIQIEGNVSQNVDLSHSFNFKKCRN